MGYWVSIIPYARQKIRKKNKSVLDRIIWIVLLFLEERVMGPFPPLGGKEKKIL